MPKPNSDVQMFLELLNEQPSYIGLLAKFPLQEFVSLACWPSLQARLRQQLYVWLFRQPMLTTGLTVKYDTSLTIAMGKLHNLSSGPLAIGYLVEIPRNYRTEVTPTYISSIYGKPTNGLSGVEDLPSLEHLLNGQHLSVFALGNAQVVAAIRKDIADFMH